MVRIRHILISLVLGYLAACSSPQESQKENPTFSTDQAREALRFAAEQYHRMIPTVPDSVLPKSIKEDSSLRITGIKDWVSGFYPGTLWYLFEYTGDSLFLAEARQRTELLEPLRHFREHHDLGFMVYCSFGNGWRITGDSAYRAVMQDAAHSLASRFMPTAGVIKSWDWTRNGSWRYPVIIDNMMNLELLTWAAKSAKKDHLLKIAISHADTTLKHHYRPDLSTWHVVDYDSLRGGTLNKLTHQGYSDSSAWARGQAWSLYGYAMMYRETQKPEYLQRAQQVAHFILTHPRLPEDKVPYWDFDAPNIPDAPRDASSAALMASALLELQSFASTDSLRQTYLGTAEHMLASLSSPAYRAQPGANGNFILMHSVGHLPGNSEVDVPLTYADYYYVEALLRYLAVKGEFQFKPVIY
ncbi:MAG: glucuronyl hydrolase [Cytophagales bacterium]|nr:glucuronyl hydrolase [Cytophagales bacterium]